MEPTDHPAPLVPDVAIALGQEAQHLRVICRLHRFEPPGAQSSQSNREGIVGVVLVRTCGGQYPDPRSQCRWHVEDRLTAGYELLGQQVAKSAGGFDGPGPLIERLGPTEQLVNLAPGGTHLDTREWLFAPINGHRGVRSLVGVDANHHLHEYLLGRVETTEGTPACSWFVIDPLLSHSEAGSP